MQRFILVGLIAMGLCACAGRADHISKTPPPSLTPSPSSISLQEAASDTYAKYMRAAVGAGAAHPGDEIPPEYWADGIKALKPIRVYMHRVNIVVVQREKDGVEEGKYIFIPISSYMPQDGVDGFRYSSDPSPTVVFDFKRTLAR